VGGRIGQDERERQRRDRQGGVRVSQPAQGSVAAGARMATWMGEHDPDGVEPALTRGDSPMRTLFSTICRTPCTYHGVVAYVVVIEDEPGIAYFPARGYRLDDTP
jgi:hypothetical protein